MGYRRPIHKAGYFYKREYIYDELSDQYACPAGQVIFYKTTSREGYSHYQSNPKICSISWALEGENAVSNGSGGTKHEKDSTDGRLRPILLICSRNITTSIQTPLILSLLNTYFFNCGVFEYQRNIDTETPETINPS